MNIDDCTQRHVHTLGEGENAPCVGLASGVLPETQRPESLESYKQGCPPATSYCEQESHATGQHITHPKDNNWYVLRATYGREKKAYDYLVDKGVRAFYPTMKEMRLINGKRQLVTVSRLPNMLFAYGEEEQIKNFVYDNINLPFLRFYYRHFHKGRDIEKIPMVVPYNQMESLKLICKAEEDDIIVTQEQTKKFETGQLVRVTKGQFTGVVGRVARYKGQQRVGIYINGLLTAATTYIPTCNLENVD